MKEIILMRHAKSSWDNPGLSDHDRPLNDRGQRDAPRMGQWLKENNLVPDMILTSTAKRANDTARIVAQNCGLKGKIETISNLYGTAPSEYLKILSQCPENAKSVMVIGHNPTLEELISLITCSIEPFPTAAIARINIPTENWKSLPQEYKKSRLIGLWRPKELFAANDQSD